MNVACNTADFDMAGSKVSQAKSIEELSVTSEDDLRSTGTSQCDEAHSRLWDSETSDHESPVSSSTSPLAPLSCLSCSRSYHLALNARRETKLLPFLCDLWVGGDMIWPPHSRKEREGGGGGE